MSQRDPYKLRPAFHGMRDREPLKPRAAARRVPVPSLDDYSWPTSEELDFFDEDDELRAATDAAEFELLWSDGFGWMAPRDEDDFERERPELPHLDDWDAYDDPYKERYRW
jgi:hypothetical protein